MLNISRIKKIATGVLVIGSALYFIELSIQPVYILFIILVFCYVLLSHKFLLSKDVIMACVYMLYLLITQLITKANTSSLVAVTFSVAYYIVASNILHSVDKTTITEASIKLIHAAALLGVIDAVWRISHPVIQAFYQGSKYYLRWKNNSIMYQDSNFVGMFLLVIYFYTMYIERKTNQKLILERILLLITIVLTFCRAAIVVTILFSYFFGNKSSDKIRKIIILICILFSGGFIYSYLSSDSSIGARFFLLRYTADFVFSSNMLRYKLFGVGLGNTINLLNIGAHNLIVESVIETGIIGTIILIIFWWRISERTKGQARIILIPFIIAGMALTPQYMPYMYTCLALIVRYETMDVVL